MPAPAKWKMDKLDRQESAGIQEMTRRIREARKQVAITVHAAARDKGMLVSGRNRERLYKQIGDHYLQLDNGLKDWSKDLVTKGAVDWHDSAIKDIKGQTGIDPSNDVTKFSREYARDIFARVSPENGRSIASVITDKMAAADVKALRDATVDVYRQASLTGMTMREIGTAIKGKWDTIAGDLSANRFIDSAGHAWEDARYVQMLVRTTTARVARDSYMDTLVQNGDDLVVVQNADGAACDICSAWDGVIISITGSSKDYPSYGQATGAGWGHPNCRCTTERVDETIDKEQIKAQAKAETPDLERKPGETDTEYRNRATADVAQYSKAFWPAAGAGEGAGAIDAAAAAKKAAEAAAKAAAEKAAGKTVKPIEDQAAQWVHRYAWDNTLKAMPSLKVEHYLKQFKPTASVKLYRFERIDHNPLLAQTGKGIHVQSWTYDKKMASGIADLNNIDQPGKWTVRSRVFKPEEIYTDFTLFPEELKKALLKKGGESDMSEVLVYKFMKRAQT